MDVLRLLKSKNRCLKRFLSYTHDFLKKSEPELLPQLSFLLAKRETALRILGLYDRKLSKITQNLRHTDQTDEFIKSLHEIFSEKTTILNEIFKTDLLLTQLIEENIEKTEKELQSSQKSKDTLQKFKSTWIAEAGDALDTTL